jgi:hypothetical protein
MRHPWDATTVSARPVTVVTRAEPGVDVLIHEVEVVTSVEKQNVETRDGHAALRIGPPDDAEVGSGVRCVA